MPGLDGLAVAAVLANQVPTCRVVILTTFGRAGYLRRAMEAGAAGFVVKDAPADVLAATIRRVMSGQRVIDPALAASTLAAGESPSPHANATCSSLHARAQRSRTSPPSSTSQKAPFATTSPAPSPRLPPGTAARRYVSPTSAAGFSRGPVGLQAYGPTAKEYRPSAVNGTSQRRGRYSMCNAAHRMPR